MAKEWVHGWGAAVAVARTRSTSGNTKGGEGINREGAGVREDETHATADLKPLMFLYNAAKCLAEARDVLSVLAMSAEPVEDMLTSCPVNAQTLSPQKEENETENGAGDGQGGKAKPTGNGKVPAKQKGKKSAGVAQGGASSSGEVDAAAASKVSLGMPTESASVSTPVGRALVMVQLEEACVRAMLGRAKGETRSNTKADEAAANDKGVTPVQR